MNTCERFSESFSDYVENILPASTKQQIETHLSACADCHATVARLDDLRDHLKNLQRVQTSDDFEAVLRARIKLDQRTRRASGPAVRRATPKRVASYSVLALMILMSSGYLLWRNDADIQAATSTGSFRIQTPIAARTTLNPSLFSTKISYPLDRITPAQLSNQASILRLASSAGSAQDSSQSGLMRPAARQEKMADISSF